MKQTTIRATPKSVRQVGYPAHICGGPMLPASALGLLGKAAPSTLARPLLCTWCYQWHGATAVEKRKADRAAAAEAT